MMLLIGMLRVLFREGQRKKIEKKSIFHSCQYALPLRRRVTRQSYAEDRRHTRVGEKREKKIKNKAHSQHELHEESDEPKHDETCVKRESKGERRKEQSAQHRRKEKPLASMTRTTTTTSGKKKKKKKKKFESSDRSFVGGAVYI